MNCDCKSAPKYHKDDCKYYTTNGEIKDPTFFTQKFNDDLQNYINDIIPFYFKITMDNNYNLILNPIYKKDQNITNWSDLSNYMKKILQEFIKKENWRINLPK